MFSMILFVLIIILTLGNFDEISVAAPYVLKDLIDFDYNLNFRQCWLIRLAEPYVLKDSIDCGQSRTLKKCWWNSIGWAVGVQGFDWLCLAELYAFMDVIDVDQI